MEPVKNSVVYEYLQRNTKGLRRRGDRLDVQQTQPPWCVYETGNPRSLVRVAGLIHRKYDGGGKRVFMRGQTQAAELNAMLPSIARGTHIVDSVLTRMTDLDGAIEEVRQGFTKNSRFRTDPILPLLQHYGARTHWLDAVDNLFVALWFACNSRSDKQPHHYEWKTHDKDRNPLSGHLYFLQAEDEEYVQDWEGEFRGGSCTKWCDLRSEISSLSMRPHAQHGVVISRLHELDRPTTVDQFDLTRTVLLDLRFPLDSEVGRLMSEQQVHLHRWMFPPTCQDDTYYRLARIRSRLRSVDAYTCKCRETVKAPHCMPNGGV